MEKQVGRRWEGSDRRLDCTHEDDVTVQSIPTQTNHDEVPTPTSTTDRIIKNNQS